MFDPETVDRLAETVTAAVIERLQPVLAGACPDADGWLDSKQAAEHLGVSVDALHRLTAARRVAFSQSAPGGPCYFRRADLDAYRMQFIQDPNA